MTLTLILPYKLHTMHDTIQVKSQSDLNQREMSQASYL